MSELQREKFEKWAITEFINITKYGSTGVYCYPDAHLAWQAWCAAIESVVVELPKEAPDDPYADQLESGLNAGYNEAIRDFKHSIDKAGIRYE